MDIKDIIKKLFGEIEACGSTQIDEERYNNIDNYEVILNYIIIQLLKNSAFINDHRYSVNKRIGRRFEND